MPKIAKELSALAVSKLKLDGRYAVGGVACLYLRIEGQSRSWVYCPTMGSRVNKAGKHVPNRLSIGIGPFPVVSLAEAREKARELRKKIREGTNPIEERRQLKASVNNAAKTKTFIECAEAVLLIKTLEFKNPKHLAQWHSTLEKYVYPVIGHKSVDEISKNDIISILNPIWLVKNETASRVRGRIETVLDYAKAIGFLTADNPAAWKGCLKPLLAQQSKVHQKKHHEALPYLEVGKFILELRMREGIAPRALEFAILTATRSSEVRGSTWDEIDFESCIWTIPGKRMKAGKEHRIPLSAQSINLLNTIPHLFGNNHIFPAPRAIQLSDTSMLAVLKRMGRSDLTQHGFRSTFRDWAGEMTNYAREVIEHALAHQLKDKTEAAYQRGDLLKKRSELMSDWGNYCYPDLRL